MILSTATSCFCSICSKGCGPGFCCMMMAVAMLQSDTRSARSWLLMMSISIVLVSDMTVSSKKWEPKDNVETESFWFASAAIL